MTQKNQADLQIWRLAYLAPAPDGDLPKWYLLVNEGPKEQILTVEGRILVFAEPGDAAALIDRYGADLPADERDLEEPFFRCHVAQSLYLLTAGEEDEERLIIDTANLLLDLIAVTGRPVPDHHRNRLKALADYFTFASDPAGFFAESGVTRDEMVESLLWATGRVVLHLTEVKP
ncbi:hypothetical protein [Acanthopleuribacter pedis]|uniref:Uncharacterized protein n=1 Tax=Acanthopleuribacter pedis TaxID=442870 RepID=A0A8J7QDH5_9BACT|nr:hypothetical protein [Acanthopleuribacter pedis]MBO1321769.1 hypothetical protein [Acanthopleuribacter pedis]